MVWFKLRSMSLYLQQNKGMHVPFVETALFFAAEVPKP